MIQRHSKKITEIINSIELDLSGKVVLTELASGPYMSTPLIASIAGAEKVYCFGKDSKYGTFLDLKNKLNEYCEELNLDNIQCIDEVSEVVIAECDIITNSGQLRPINSDILKFVKESAVVPIMYESWEFRSEDIDIDFCKQNKILVGGTNEQHPKIDVFGFLGDLLLKQIFDVGMCVYENSIHLICNNDFAPHLIAPLAKLSKKLYFTGDEKYTKGFELVHVSNEINSTIVSESDIIVYCGAPFFEELLPDSFYDNLKKDSRYVKLLNFSGALNEDKLTDLGIDFHPKGLKKGHMGILPSAIGWDPIIRLQAGGLKVGEDLSNRKLDSPYIDKVWN